MCDGRTPAILINPMMVEGPNPRRPSRMAIGNALYGMDGLRRGRPAGDHDVCRLFAADLDRSADARHRYKETRSPLNPLGVKRRRRSRYDFPARAALISAVEDALSPFAVRIGQVPLPPMTIMAMIRNGK